MTTEQQAPMHLSEAQFQALADKFRAWAGTLSEEEQHALGALMVQGAQLREEFQADVSGFWFQCNP